MLRITETENGKVRGIASADPRITVFKGIPFAAPPVGALRWHAPTPCDNWDGIRDCIEFAPISVQDTPGLGTDIYCREWHVDPDIPMSEDCLYLNIWTSAKSKDEKLPVLVWYFGGAFQWGYPSEMEFDGEHIARRGVIVVSVNYRLGALGFMAHPELTKENPQAPANFGNLDQQFGLKWVRRNIANFGGDPDNITVAGQSAGGSSVLTQITCEDNYKDISKAIILSGLIRDPYQKDELIVPKSLGEVEKKGMEFIEFLGCKNIEEARKKDALFIRDKYAEFRNNHGMFATCIDNKLVVGDPYINLKSGRFAPIPLISGNTLDEFIGKVPYNYPESEFANKPFSIIEASVKAAFDGISKLADAHSVYYYRFKPTIPGDDNPGCFHSVDLWFFFDNISKCTRPYKGNHFELSEEMCDYYTNFMKNGDPNGIMRDGTPLPKWEPYTYSNKVEMNFTDDGPKVSIGNTPLIETVVSDMK